MQLARLGRQFGQRRRAEKRVLEGRVPTAAHRPGSELASEPRLEPSTLRPDRASDGCVALGVTVEDPARPVGFGDDSRRQPGDRLGLLQADGGLFEVCERPRIGTADGQRPALETRTDRRVPLQRHVAELCEPVAVLLDQVEGEPVWPCRDRRPHPDLPPDAFPRLDRPLERMAGAVPDDRVPAFVEPVVSELDSLAAARAPGREAGVLELHPHYFLGSCPERRQLDREPPDGQRPGGDWMLDDPFHATTLGALPVAALLAA